MQLQRKIQMQTMAKKEGEGTETKEPTLDTSIIDKSRYVQPSDNQPTIPPEECKPSNS
jgi:hypothetical protein